MHLSKPFFMLFFAMISFSCRNDNDVIAEVNTRMIIRSEFHNWLRNRDINPSEIFKNRGETEKQLKQMAVESLTVEEAVSKKFDITPFYNNINRAVYANFLSLNYKSEIIKNLSYTETAAELKIIKLCFPESLSSSHDREVYRDKIALAGHIIRQEKSGVGFDELTLKYSEEKHNPAGGKPYVVPLLLLDKAIFEKIKNLQDGECVSEPVVQQGSILIVKFIRWLTITNDNADKVINDKKIYDKFLEHLSEEAIEYIIAENGADLNVLSNIERARFINRKELLFSINGKSFTAGDLDELLNLFVFLKSGETGYTAGREEKKNMALTILNEQMLSCIAETKGICDSEEFRNKWESIRKSTLAGAYKYYMLSGKNRDVKKFSSGDTSPVNGVTEKVKIEWENNLLNLNNFVIHKGVLF